MSLVKRPRAGIVSLVLGQIMTNQIKVEVAYATPEKQKIVEVLVDEGTSAQLAVDQSGIEKHFPGVDMVAAPKGIFGNALGARGMPEAADYILKEGERVEVYRPLIADPKEARKQRAAEAAERRAADKK